VCDDKYDALMMDIAYDLKQLQMGKVGWGRGPLKGTKL